MPPSGPRSTEEHSLFSPLAKRVAPMRSLNEEPSVELIHRVGPCPRVMGHVRVFGVTHPAAQTAQSTDHRPGVFHGVCVVQGAMKRPNREFNDDLCSTRITHAGAGHCCGKGPRMSRDQIPRPRAPHGRAGDVQALRIDRILTPHVFKRFPNGATYLVLFHLTLVVVAKRATTGVRPFSSIWTVGRKHQSWLYPLCP